MVVVDNPTDLSILPLQVADPQQTEDLAFLHTGVEKFLNLQFGDTSRSFHERLQIISRLNFDVESSDWSLLKIPDLQFWDIPVISLTSVLLAIGKWFLLPMVSKMGGFKIPGTSKPSRFHVVQSSIVRRQSSRPKRHLTPNKETYQVPACSQSSSQSENPCVNPQLQGFSKLLSAKVSDASNFPPVSLADLDQLDDWAILDEWEVPEDIGQLAEIQDADQDECILFRDVVTPGNWQNHLGVVPEADRRQAGLSAHSENSESLAQNEGQASILSRSELDPVVPEVDQLPFSRCLEDDSGRLGHESHQLQVLLDTFENDPSVKVDNFLWGTDMIRQIPEEHLVDPGYLGLPVVNASDLTASDPSPSEVFDDSPIELSPEDFAMAKALFGDDQEPRQELELETHHGELAWTEEHLEHAVHEFLMSQLPHGQCFSFGSQPAHKPLAINHRLLAYQSHGAGGSFDHAYAMHSRPRLQQIQGNPGAHREWVGQQSTASQDSSIGYQHQILHDNFGVHQGLFAQRSAFGYPSVFESIFSGMPMTPQDQFFRCPSMPSLPVESAPPQDSRILTSERRAAPRASGTSTK